MAFTVHEGMISDPAGDIHMRVAGDRATVDAVAATHTKTATEMRDWLYQLVAAAYMRRDRELLLQTMKTIMDFNGWEAGGGKTAVDAEAGP